MSTDGGDGCHVGSRGRSHGRAPLADEDRAQVRAHRPVATSAHARAGICCPHMPVRRHPPPPPHGRRAPGATGFGHAHQPHQGPVAHGRQPFRGRRCRGARAFRRPPLPVFVFPRPAFLNPRAPDAPSFHRHHVCPALPFFARPGPAVPDPSLPSFPSLPFSPVPSPSFPTLPSHPYLSCPSILTLLLHPIPLLPCPSAPPPPHLAFLLLTFKLLN